MKNVLVDVCQKNTHLRMQSIDVRWKTKSLMTARSRGELIAGNHAPWRLGMGMGISLKKMKGATMGYTNTNMMLQCL